MNPRKLVWEWELDELNPESDWPEIKKIIKLRKYKAGMIREMKKFWGSWVRKISRRKRSWGISEEAQGEELAEDMKTKSEDSKGKAEDSKGMAEAEEDMKTKAEEFAYKKDEGEDDIFKAIEKVIGKTTIEKEELLEEANKKHNKKFNLNNICWVKEKYKYN